MPDSALDTLVTRLEEAARDLRRETLSSEQAAELVDACATTAGEAVTELDRLARLAETSAPGPDQLELRSA